MNLSDKAKYEKIRDLVEERINPNCFAYFIDETIVELLMLLTNDHISDTNVLIPNISMGELAVCSNRIVTYSSKEITNDVLSKITGSIEVITNEFTGSEVIIKKYDRVVLYIRKEKDISYMKSTLEKSLASLNDNGRLIALLPQSMLIEKDFKDLREKLLLPESNFSFEGIFSIKQINKADSNYYSIVVIEKKKQSKKIYMNDSASDYWGDEVYSGYKSKELGFWVDSKKVWNRLDANYYNPEKQKERELIQVKENVKLGSIAEIFVGLNVKHLVNKAHREYEQSGRYLYYSEEGGNYLIILPQYLYDGVIHFGNNNKYYCSKETIGNNQKYLLIKGDIVLSATGKHDWAIYGGPEEYAVANHNIIIIRAKEDSKKLFNLFFNSKTGREYFDSQLSFLSHCEVYGDKLVNGTLSLNDIYVPDPQNDKFKLFIHSNQEISFATCFKNVGWNVKEKYHDENFCYDFALFNGDVLEAVVEIKRYKSEEFATNKKLIEQLTRLKKHLGNKKVFIFVDDAIYEFKEGVIEQQSGIPEPSKCFNNEDEEKKVSKQLLVIKKSVDEGNISNDFLVEMLLKLFPDQINTILVNLSKKLIDHKMRLKQSDLCYDVDVLGQLYSDRCLDEVCILPKTDLAKDEEKNLFILFGDDAWNKLDEKSKKCLISAKVIFNFLSKSNENVDYSPVCGSVSKALEIELTKRFYSGFLDFLKSKYGQRDLSIYPTVLIRNKKILSIDNFHLGAIAHIICYFTEVGNYYANIKNSLSVEDYCKETRISENQYLNNKKKLFEYCKERLFTDENEQEIQRLLVEYGKGIEEVREKYRNPAAHIDEMNIESAKNCIDLVIEIQKLLIKMLNSFKF